VIIIINPAHQYVLICFQRQNRVVTAQETC